MYIYLFFSTLFPVSLFVIAAIFANRQDSDFKHVACNALEKRVDSLSLLFAFLVFGLDLSADHVLRKRTVGLLPCIPDGVSKVALQRRLECVHQSVSHDGKHLRLDTITHVLGSKLGHDLGQMLDIGTQHIQCRVEHLNKVHCVHDELLARKELGRIWININWESK
jgi:hypothetical protein